MILRKAHAILHSHKLFLAFTWITRFLLALAFLPSGLKKVMGERFTTLGLDSPVGFFFEALYRTGFYWNFLGGMQLLTAALLLIPRTAAFGALLYLPIAINIFLITVAMNFIGTPIITGLMLLANLYLLLWDYPKLQTSANAIFQKS